MRIELTRQECIWLADLVSKSKDEACRAHEETPHALLLLRRDNMAALETRLNAAIQKEIKKNERNFGR